MADAEFVLDKKGDKSMPQTPESKQIVPPIRIVRQRQVITQAPQLPNGDSSLSSDEKKIRSTPIGASNMSRKVRKRDTNVRTPRSRKQTPVKNRTIFLPSQVAIVVNRDKLTELTEQECDNAYVGDIIWAKAKGFPWWPCMIAVDPTTGSYSQLDAKNHRIFHVQYFGRDPTRGYTTAGMTMPFEGREKYELEIDRIKNQPTPMKSKQKCELQKWVIKPHLKRDWSTAVDEADAASKLDRAERLRQLTFEYVVVQEQPSPMEISLNKRKSTGETSTTDSTVKKRRKSSTATQDVYEFDDFDDDKSAENESPTLMLWSAKRADRQSDYNVFVQRMRQHVERENPDANSEKIDSILKEKWQLMSDDLKSQYRIRKTAETSPASSSTTADKVKTETPMKIAKKTPRKRRSIKNEIDAITPKKPGLDEPIVENVNNDDDDSDEEKALVIAENEGVKKKRSRNTPASLKKKTTVKEKTSAKEKTTPKEKTAAKDKTPAKEKAPKEKPATTPSRRKGAPAEPVPADEIKVEETKLEKSVTAKSATKSRKRSEPSGDENVVSRSKGIKALKRSHIDVMKLMATSSEETSSSQSETETGDNNGVENIKAAAAKICHNCVELTDKSVSCAGTCLKSYHEKCLPKDFNQESSLCQECASGEHRCWVCNKHSVDVIRCTQNKCGKNYHIKCLEKNYPYKLSDRKDGETFFSCPLHFCLTCYTEFKDDNNYRFVRKSLSRCLKCPTAYHHIDSCLAAGSITIAPPYILCPEHLNEAKGAKHMNTNYCFSCNLGGNLVCCERCPAAFHLTCLDYTPPESSFFCIDCMNRKQLHYGDIVWVKLGTYRWWPAKVCHPSEVPQNVMNLSHNTGEFPVYFFGSHDYYWIHRGKAFHFVDEDCERLHTLTKGKMPAFKLAMTEAIEAFSEWQRQKTDDVAFKTASKPSPFTYIKVNRPVGLKQKEKEKDKTQPDDKLCQNKCTCEPDSEYPCSGDTECFNRLIMIECDSSICNADDKCCNRRFKKREYAQVTSFKTPKRGWGLKALEDIKKGQFVIEYVGELIDEVECEARIEAMIAKNDTNFYFLTIDSNCIIDAGPKGNHARFMNHSCSPNCETQKWMVGKSTRVGLFAITDIPAGSELTFNYNLQSRGDEKTKCECGAPNCSGFLGLRPVKSVDENAKKIKPIKKARALKKEDISEDDCFICGEGGELVMCDRRKCPKSFHLACLNQEKLPHGKWDCPWHFCDECGKPAAHRCQLCPTSFCGTHSQLTEVEGGVKICSLHTEEDLKNVPPAKLLIDKADSEEKSETEATDVKPKRGRKKSLITTVDDEKKSVKETSSVEKESSEEKSDENEVKPKRNGSRRKQSAVATDDLPKNVAGEPVTENFHTETTKKKGDLSISDENETKTKKNTGRRKTSVSATPQFDSKKEEKLKTTEKKEKSAEPEVRSKRIANRKKASLAPESPQSDSIGKIEKNSTEEKVTKMTEEKAYKSDTVIEKEVKTKRSSRKNLMIYDPPKVDAEVDAKVAMAHETKATEDSVDTHPSRQTTEKVQINGKVENEELKIVMSVSEGSEAQKAVTNPIEILANGVLQENDEEILDDVRELMSTVVDHVTLEIDAH